MKSHHNDSNNMSKHSSVCAGKDKGKWCSNSDSDRKKSRERSQSSERHLHRESQSNLDVDTNLPAEHTHSIHFSTHFKYDAKGNCEKIPEEKGNKTDCRLSQTSRWDSTLNHGDRGETETENIKCLRKIETKEKARAKNDNSLNLVEIQMDTSNCDKDLENSDYSYSDSDDYSGSEEEDFEDYIIRINCADSQEKDSNPDVHSMTVAKSKSSHTADEQDNKSIAECRSRSEGSVESNKSDEVENIQSHETNCDKESIMDCTNIEPCETGKAKVVDSSSETNSKPPLKGKPLPVALSQGKENDIDGLKKSSSICSKSVKEVLTELFDVSSQMSSESDEKMPSDEELCPPGVDDYTSDSKSLKTACDTHFDGISDSFSTKDMCTENTDVQHTTIETETYSVVDEDILESNLQSSPFDCDNAVNFNNLKTLGEESEQHSIKKDLDNCYLNDADQEVLQSEIAVNICPDVFIDKSTRKHSVSESSSSSSDSCSTCSSSSSSTSSSANSTDSETPFVGGQEGQELTTTTVPLKDTCLLHQDKSQQIVQTVTCSDQIKEKGLVDYKSDDENQVDNNELGPYKEVASLQKKSDAGSKAKRESLGLLKVKPIKMFLKSTTALKTVSPLCSESKSDDAKSEKSEHMEVSKVVSALDEIKQNIKEKLEFQEEMKMEGEKQPDNSSQKYKDHEVQFNENKSEIPPEKTDGQKKEVTDYKRNHDYDRKYHDKKYEDKRYEDKDYGEREYAKSSRRNKRSHSRSRKEERSHESKRSYSRSHSDSKYYSKFHYYHKESKNSRRSDEKVSHHSKTKYPVNSMNKSGKPALSKELQRLADEMKQTNGARKIVFDDLGPLENQSQTAGYCFVEFSDTDSAHSAMLKLNGKAIPGSSPPKLFKLNHASFGREHLQIPEYSLYVGELSKDVDDLALYRTFASRYSSVRAAKVVRELGHCGESKGFGFVRFTSEEEQQLALIEMQNHTKLGQKPIRVSLAVPKKVQSAPLTQPHSFHQQQTGHGYSNQYYQQYPQNTYNSVPPPQNWWQQYLDYYSGYPSSTVTTASGTTVDSTVQSSTYMQSHGDNQEEYDDETLEDPEIEIDVEKANKEFFEKSEELYMALEGSRWHPLDNVFSQIAPEAPDLPK